MTEHKFSRREFTLGLAAATAGGFVAGCAQGIPTAPAMATTAPPAERPAEPSGMVVVP